MHRIGIVVGAVSLFLTVGAAAVPAEPVGGPPDPPPEQPAVVRQAASPRVPVAVSHRGAAGHAPENTIAGIETARELGAAVVEVDVQRTADGELVLMHDATLTRTTDVREVFPDKDSYEVGDLTLEEIRELDAGSWFSPSFEGERVPTLEEALERLEELELGLFLEIKEPERHPGIEEDVADELRDHGDRLHGSTPEGERALVVQSFDWEVVRRSHDLLPSVPHALLGRVPENRIAEFTWAEMINPEHTSIDASYVEQVHRHGLETMPYTVNERSDMDAVLNRGVDGFITDYVDTAQEAIADFVGARRAHRSVDEVIAPLVAVH
ncbi:glycerophosphodiester phosphodiesterase family protein [Nocardiopsis algeriensis]|uniref:Glycerophosphoryl diester phosphodiesterase n=1 Tax=Nocardiopsis algeriensis TaxID=1478215 RepID=A0A841IQY3_9ACTN|nr:glycerophosphoryl diester phosphodiesterase [Nocardiopsis algeriensis]